MIDRIAGWELVASFEKDERVVSMIEFKGEMYIATDRRIFRLVEGARSPVRFWNDP